MFVCVKERERETERTIYVDVTDDVADVALVDDLDVVAPSGAIPPKAHQTRNRPRCTYRFGSISPEMYSIFCSSKSFLLRPTIIQRLR